MSLLLERTVNLHHTALQQAYSVLKENYYFNSGAGKRCCNWSYQNICYDCISSETFFGIVRHMVQQGVRFTAIQISPMAFEKSAKIPAKLLKCNRTLFSTANVQNLQSFSQLPEFTEQMSWSTLLMWPVCKNTDYTKKIKISNAMEQVKTGTLLLVQHDKNSINATIGRLRILLNPFAMKWLNSIEKILPRMMIENVNGNLSTITISCHIPANVNEKNDVLLDFSKKQLYRNHTSTWVFSCKFAAYF